MLLRDNTARARQIISIFWIMLGVTVVNCGSLAWRYSILLDIKADPANFDMQVANLTDLMQSILALTNLVVFVLAATFFIMWFRRAYNNLHQLPWHNTRYTEGWAAGSWFVPVVNLWWPYQIMVDIWKGTQNALRQRLGEPHAATIVGWWWALFFANILWSIITIAVGTTNGVDELLISTQLHLIGQIIDIPALLIAIRMIQRTNFFERELLIHSQTPTDSIFSDNYTPPVETIEPKLEN